MEKNFKNVLLNAQKDIEKVAVQELRNEYNEKIEEIEKQVKDEEVRYKKTQIVYQIEDAQKKLSELEKEHEVNINKLTSEWHSIRDMIDKLNVIILQ